MALVAWAPKGMHAPVELTAVMIKPGKITQSDWIDALADRVTDMAMAEPDPEKAVAWACRHLEIPAWPSDPRQAGQFLVSGNWLLLDNVMHQQSGASDPFPAKVTGSDDEADYAIDNCDFEFWVELAYEKR